MQTTTASSPSEGDMAPRRAFAGRLELGDEGVLCAGPWLALRTLGWLVLLGTVVEGLALFPMLAGRLFGIHIALTPEFIGLLLLAMGSAYALLVRLGERRAPHELSLAAAAAQLALGALIGAGVIAIVYAILIGAGLYQVWPGHTPVWTLQVLYNFATAFDEELLFRAIAFRLLARLLGPAPALILSAAMFGLAHLVTPDANLFAALYIALGAGLLLAACLLLTGRLWPAVGLHAGWNFMEGPVFGATVSGHVRPDTLLTSGPTMNAPVLWSGGSYGPEASPITALVGVVAFLAVMALVSRYGTPPMRKFNV